VYEYLFLAKTTQKKSLRSDEEDSDLLRAAEPGPGVGDDDDEAQQNNIRKKQLRWFEAISAGDEKLVEQFLNEEDSLIIDAVTREGSTALHIASYKGHHNIVVRLLAAKPSLADVANNDGSTALHLAALYGKESIVQLLLASGGPTLGLLTSHEGRTPLVCAVLAKRLREAEILLAACPAALDVADQNHVTALLYAFANNHQEMVNVLLAANPQNVQAIDDNCNDFNALHHAVRGGQVEHVEQLLAIDPSLIRSLTYELQSPLWLAVEKEHNVLIENLFLRFPQAVRMADDKGVTPFHLAVQLRNEDAVRLFLPKLTFEDMVRGYWKFGLIFSNWVNLSRSMLWQCEDVVPLPSEVLKEVFSYLGFGV